MTDRNLCKELMKKSSGAIRETILMMNTAWTNDDIISKLRQDFSSMSTMNRAQRRTQRPQAVTRSVNKLFICTNMVGFISLQQGNQAHNER